MSQAHTKAANATNQAQGAADPAAEGQDGAPKKKERMRAVFSSQEVRVVGTGTTRRKSIKKVFWFVEENEAGEIEVQSINANYIPVGAKKKITRDELLEKYSPEPEFYTQSVYPKIREMNESINEGDRCREKGENFSAEFQYGNALALDEENVRANFGIGLSYLARGETDKADNIFDRLVHLEATFKEEHKHLFNDFGINLRKNKMYKQAQEYYSRALELTRGDENLHINMARTMLEGKEIAGCVDHLMEALRLSPRNETVMKFLDWLDKKKLVPPECRSVVSAALQSGEAAPRAASTVPTAPAEEPQPAGAAEEDGAQDGADSLSDNAASSGAASSDAASGNAVSS